MLYFELIPIEIIAIIVDKVYTCKDFINIFKIVGDNKYVNTRYMMINSGVVSGYIYYLDISDCLVGSKDHLIQKFYEDVVVEFSIFDSGKPKCISDIKRESVSKYDLNIIGDGLLWTLSEVSNQISVDVLEYGDDPLHLHAILIPISLLL